MNVISLIKQVRYLLDIDNKEILQLLQQQREILRHGHEGTAEILRRYIYDRRIGKQQRVELWLKLKKSDSSFVYTYSLALIDNSNIPSCGSVVRIRYLPKNLSTIIILGEEKADYYRTTPNRIS